MNYHDYQKRKRKKAKKKKFEEAEMNLTPMIDVVFLLLIFFLCLEFKTLEGKLATNLPKDVGVNTSQAMPIEKLDIRVAQVNWGKQVKSKHDPRRFELEGHKVAYFVNARRISTIPDLERVLRKAVKVKVTDAKGKSKARPITIKTSAGVTYGDVTELIDTAIDSGFEEITFGGGEGTRKNPNAK